MSATGFQRKRRQRLMKVREEEQKEKDKVNRRSELGDMTRDELRDVAKEKGIKGWGQMNKEELIDGISEVEAE